VQNETSQTLGSIQSTDAEKRALARQSRDYNLKDKVFRELFTDLTAEMQVEQAAEKAAAAAQQQSATSSSTGATKTDDDKKKCVHSVCPCVRVS
jgi:ubiquitin-conjugating enzyme E2 J2